MITIENNRGRLIELRQTGRITIDEIQRSLPEFQAILDSKSSPFVLATDWRGMHLLDGQTSEFLLDIMKAETDRIERHVVIAEESALMGMQIRRLFKTAGGRTRAVYNSVTEAEQWIRPALTDVEFARFQRFMQGNSEN
jgi:hypothetical protein